MSVKTIKKQILADDDEDDFNVDFVSSGSTPLNLACTGHTRKAFPKGHYVLIVGDSESGKTFISATCLAEAAADPAFDDYTFAYYDIEAGLLANLRRYFGRKAAFRIKKDQPTIPETVEELYDSLDDLVKKNVPFIAVVDSADSLPSKEDLKQVAKERKARVKDEQVSGSYNTAKPKVHSARLRNIVPKLKKTGSILIVISQTRDAIGFMSRFEPKTRAGGRALKFYACLEIWTSVGRPIKVKPKGGKKEFQVGAFSVAKVKKNRINGKKRSVQVAFLNEVGIDDVRSNIQYLVDQGYWRVSSKVINAKELGLSGKMNELIRQIESRDLEGKLRKVVGKHWRGVENILNPKRKRRYE